MSYSEIRKKYFRTNKKCTCKNCGYINWFTCISTKKEHDYLVQKLFYTYIFLRPRTGKILQREVSRTRIYVLLLFHFKYVWWIYL